MDLGVVASVVAVLVAIGIFDYFLRKHRRENRAEKIGERQRTADAYHDQFKRVDVFPTRNGPVTVTWRTHFDVSSEIAKGADPFNLDVVFPEISEREEPRQNPSTGEIRRVEQIKEKIAELLAANPDADLHHHEGTLRIKVLRVERTWETEEEDSDSFDAIFRDAQTAADFERKRKEFLAANPDLPDHTRKRLDNMLQNRIRQLMEK
ncbi:MAG TPA: hypothetical protein VNG73_03620 [Gemmatimonadaceae bacterium]|nr:hypothetical protein [Gemmatimonadaceae bacterium]